MKFPAFESVSASDNIYHISFALRRGRATQLNKNLLSFNFDFQVLQTSIQDSKH